MFVNSIIPEVSLCPCSDYIVGILCWNIGAFCNSSAVSSVYSILSFAAFRRSSSEVRTRKIRVVCEASVLQPTYSYLTVKNCPWIMSNQPDPKLGVSRMPSNNNALSHTHQKTGPFSADREANHLNPEASLIKLDQDHPKQTMKVISNVHIF